MIQPGGIARAPGSGHSCLVTAAILGSSELVVIVVNGCDIIVPAKVRSAKFLFNPLTSSSTLGSA